MTALPKRSHESDEATSLLASGTVANALDTLGVIRVGAALEVDDCMRVLAKSGSNLVAEALGTHEFIEWDHYPPTPESALFVGVTK